MHTLEQLQAQRVETSNKIRSKEGNMPENLSLIKQLDEQIKSAKIAAKIADVNQQQAEVREIARQIFEAEEVREDIRSKEGQFHKAKIKKYPKLAEFCQDRYVKPYFNNGIMLSLTVGRKSYYMYKTKYNEKTMEHESIKITDFQEFLEYNGIAPDITTEEYNNKAKRLAEAETALKAALEQYRAITSEEKAHIYQDLGLLYRYQETTYTFRTI